MTAKSILDKGYSGSLTCVLDGVPSTVTCASLLNDGSPFDLKSANGRLYVTIPAEQRDSISTVVILK